MNLGNRNPCESSRTESLRVPGVAFFTPTNRVGTSEIRTFTLSSNLGIYGGHCWRSKRMNLYWGSFPRASRFPPPLAGGWGRNKGTQIFEERGESCRSPNLGQRSQKFRASSSTKVTWKICELWVQLLVELQEACSLPWSWRRATQNPSRKTQRPIEFPMKKFWYQ